MTAILGPRCSRRWCEHRTGSADASSARIAGVMDLVALAILSLFGSLAAGGLVGFLISRFTRFEVGLGVGLLVPGVVCLWFAALCLLEYRAFIHAGPNGAWGEVVTIEERPVNAAGDITQPVPVIRFTAPDDSVHTIRGPGSGSLQPGDAVNVIYDANDPARSRIGQVSELRGGAIAMLLFGTFPFSFGLWLLYAYARGGAEQDEFTQRKGQKTSDAVVRSQPGKIASSLLFLGMFGGTLWIGVGTGALEQRFVQGFGTVAAALLGYAIWGMASRSASPVWSAGFAVLGINFGVWAYALHLLVG